MYTNKQLHWMYVAYVYKQTITLDVCSICKQTHNYTHITHIYTYTRIFLFTSGKFRLGFTGLIVLIINVNNIEPWHVCLLCVRSSSGHIDLSK